MRTIKDVIVNGISLVTKGNTPAVPHAETGFAIFKVFSRGPNAEQIAKLSEVSSRLGAVANDIGTAGSGGKNASDIS